MDDHETFTRTWCITPDAAYGLELMLKVLFNGPDNESTNQFVQFLASGATEDYIGIAPIKSGTVAVINLPTVDGEFLRSMPAAAFNTLVGSKRHYAALLLELSGEQPTTTCSLVIGTIEGSHVIELTEGAYEMLAGLGSMGVPVVKQYYRHKFSGHDGKDLIGAVGVLTTYAGRDEFTLSIEFLLKEQAEAFVLPEEWKSEEITGLNYDHMLATSALVDA